MHRRGFGGLLTDGQWNALVSTASRIPFVEGQTLLHQGDDASGVHLVLTGRVRVVVVRADGSSVPLAFRACGEVLGESVLGGEENTRSATVTALCTGATAYLPARVFRDRLRELDLEGALWQSVLQRQGESDRLRVQQATLPADRRLPAALVQLASMLGEPTPAALTDAPETPGEGRLLRVPLPQQEIADFVGLSRTSVHHAYTRLKERNLIRTGHRYVAILDLGALEALAYGEDPE
ncbi:cAMP-activated global transcriptional regulator CRP [Nocardiopsis dassonvillei]|uniref:Crp/Fnr family transcriptional regulator n=1 Tax=Nocardiopsis dassonvillei TaxID=2014 RepID=UPI003F57C0BA